MNWYLTLILLSICINYIWNYSGFIYDFFKMIYEILNPGKIYLLNLRKPFNCYVCTIFWFSLIYCLFYTNLFNSIIIATGLAFVNTFIKKIIGKIIYLIETI